MSPTDTAELLAAYRPVLQYDSRELYFAEHPSLLVDRPGNRLCRADGTTIAVATTSAGLLELLRPHAYLGGEPVAAGDHLVLLEHAAPVRVPASLANTLFGRVVTDAAGGRWLQYWMFFSYNDPGLFGIGTHEGDLEMMQLKIRPDDRPEQAVYAQHRDGYLARWDHVERDPAHDHAPVVYCARGSHASLFRRGHLFGRSPIPDRNDAQGLRVRSNVVEFTHERTPWAWWPGRWGSTRAPGRFLSRTGVAANSPNSPTSHLAWRDPEAFAAHCRHADLQPIPRSPTPSK